MSETSEAHRQVWERAAAQVTAEELQMSRGERHNDVRIDALEAKVDRLERALNEATSQLSRVCGEVDGMRHENVRRRWRLP